MVMFNWFARLQPQQWAILSAVAGFIFYGLWAYWVNRDHGLLLAVKAACTQGTYSFILTFVMTVLIEAIYRHFLKLFDNYLLIIWLTIVLTCALIFSASWLVHFLAGTPEIFKTVALGYFFGGLYSIIYVYSLAKVSMRDA